MKKLSYFKNQTYKLTLFVNGNRNQMNNVQFQTLKDFYNIVRYKTADSIRLNHLFIKVSAIDMFFAEIEGIKPTDENVEQIELAMFDTENSPYNVQV